MADERTEAAIQADLARVRSALATLEGDIDRKLIDYAKGGRSFTKSRRYDSLMKREERLLEELRGFPHTEEVQLDDADLDD